MRMARVLAIAVASGRVGHVFLSGQELQDWGLSRRAAKSSEAAASYTTELIARLRPEILVTEKITRRCRKGRKTCEIIEGIAQVGAYHELYDVAVPKPRSLANKYVEAEALANRFPDLRSRLPKPRQLWDTESRNVTIFEALALALVVIDKELAA